MHSLAAELRHYELTQRLYDLGDEVADYVEHILQAIADWDVELVQDCLEELEEIVLDDTPDSRATTNELVGLRQALTSGIFAGTLSWRGAPRTVDEPGQLTVEDLTGAYPLTSTPVKITELHTVLQLRAERVGEYLREVVAWVLDSTNYVANNLQRVSLSTVFRRAENKTRIAVNSWLECVASNTSYTRSMRGSNPPEFLNERAWADSIADKVWGSESRYWGS